MTSAPAPIASAPIAPAPAAVDVVEAMRRRRMHREFEDRPVPHEVLQQLVWGAVRAQQARSGVRHLVVVDDPALMATARQVFPGFINNAPAMIVHCTDLRRADEVMGARGVSHATLLDAGAACAHLALLGQALGLGVCTITSWSDVAVRELLGLPDWLRPDVTVAVGYAPTKPPGAAKGFRTSLHDNQFGVDFDRVSL